MNPINDRREPSTKRVQLALGAISQAVTIPRLFDTLNGSALCRYA